MSYTEEQLESLHLANRRLEHTGNNQIAAKVNYLKSIDAPYEEIWAVAQANVTEMVKPEKLTDAIPPPPIQGPGSGLKKWRKFALQVSDIEEEIILSMGRNDIVIVLADRGIIEKPEFLPGYK